jgi:hypothetical protein
MPTFNKQDLLSELMDRTDCISSSMQGFLRLTNDQLNYKPEGSKWSIAEIFEHLHISHQVYINIIVHQINNAADVSEKHYASGWLGDWAFDWLLPGPGRVALKLKEKKYHAHPLALDGKEVLDRFLQQLDTIHDIIRHASTKDLHRIKIPLSSNKLLKLRLGDNLRYLVANSERHVLHAKQLMAQAS